MSEDFYNKMNSFTDFSALTDSKNFVDVPSDWVVIITDIQGSTKAIEAGRYKDVNTIGAATMVALNNVMKNIEYPFVFGGDGATVVIPKSKLTDATKELSGLYVVSKTKFQLHLRVGMIEMQEIIDAGKKVQVAKYTLSSGINIALFQGGGLAFAEKKIKGEQEKYAMHLDEEVETDLRDLSCLWKPLYASNGNILSLLVSSYEGDETNNYQEFFRQFHQIVQSIHSANPIARKSMSFDASIQSFRNNLRFQWSLWGSVKRFFLSLKVFFAMKSGIGYVLPDVKNYLDKTPEHSDYHKFDEMLRMVLDVTPEQIAKITRLCEQMHAEKKIFYGMHISDHALMTCVVPSYENGKHIHFVDGGDGGYALAAKSLKLQLKNAST